MECNCGTQVLRTTGDDSYFVGERHGCGWIFNEEELDVNCKFDISEKRKVNDGRFVEAAILWSVVAFGCECGRG